jgi:putative membrane protein
MSLLKKASIVPLFMLVMASSAWAQSGTPNASMPATGASGAHTTQDVRFVTAASAAGQTEVLASRLAEAQAQSANIKSFATLMIRDHSKANAELKSIAQKDGYTLSNQPTQEQEANIAKLRGLHGKEFDTAYAAMMVKDHREAVALFQSESTSGNEGDLKSFAMQTLPTLQHHLALATAL